MVLVEKDVTFERFEELLQRGYQRNSHISRVKVEFSDGHLRGAIEFESKDGFNADQMQRRGMVALTSRDENMFVKEVTINEFYRRVREFYQGDNYICAIDAELFDGHERMVIAFTSHEGPATDQAKRRGNLEYRIMGKQEAHP